MINESDLIEILPNFHKYIVIPNPMAECLPSFRPWEDRLGFRKLGRHHAPKSIYDILVGWAFDLVESIIRA